MTLLMRLAVVNSQASLTARPKPTVWLIAAFALILVYSAAPAPAQTFEVLHSFTGKSGGNSPYGQVIVDSAGNIYGTTGYGGFYGAAQCSGAGCGLAFKLDPAGQQSTIFDFKGRESGSLPQAGLLRDARGNFYGTTDFGGDTVHCAAPRGCGTVFKIDGNGRETILHQFTGGLDGIQPQAALIQDAAGNLYGTTIAGGARLAGTVFKIDPAGNETILHRFSGRPDGRTPLAGLTIDAQGNLYGGTEFGGTGTNCGDSGCGVIFKIDSAGRESVLYSFSGGEDGSETGATLLVDSAGNLYGMTGLGGILTCNAPFGCGVVFKIDSAGAETVLYRFADETMNGWDPQSGVVRDASGDLYGTTYRGGANGMGTVFKLDLAGNQTLLHSFTGGADGAFPAAGLAIDAAGNLYGTTVAGGHPGCMFEQGCGVLFKITPLRVSAGPL